jgi:hypothetical protein
VKVLLLQLDGKLPNIALMRIAAHHRELGDDVQLRRISSPLMIHPDFFCKPDKVYASLIFDWSKPVARKVLSVWPWAIVGGTGWDLTQGSALVNVGEQSVTTLESIGITTVQQDYSDYPGYVFSMGYTQRGCRLKCHHCPVPRMEGKVREVQTVNDIWRGPGHPKNVVLMDNDFFGQPHWRERIREIQDGGFKVSFNQGVNARLFDDESAEAIASVPYYDAKFERRSIYTAWDLKGDEDRVFKGLHALVRYGVKPDNITVYMLIGKAPGETHEDREYRRKRLRDFGARPYPMPWDRTNRELQRYSTWVVLRMDLMCSWEEFYVRAKGRPEHVKPEPTFPMFDGHAAIATEVAG